MPVFGVLGAFQDPTPAYLLSSLAPNSADQTEHD